MTLLPAFRNQMIGTAFFQKLLKQAQEWGKPMALYLKRWNPEARRLYLRLAFQDEEDLGSHWKMKWLPE